jgi:hypothetical protein
LCLQQTKNAAFLWQRTTAQIYYSVKLPHYLATVSSHHQSYPKNIKRKKRIWSCFIPVVLLIKHKLCIYLNIRSVKTQQTVCEVVSQCNIHQYLKNNYMFRPCKRAIIRLFLQILIIHRLGCFGGMGFMRFDREGVV